MSIDRTSIELSRSWRLFCSLMLTWVVLIHSSGFVGVFVLDDEPLIIGSAYQPFFGFAWFSLSNRPFAEFTFAAQFATIGGSTTACHFVNIAIHAAATLTLACLVELVLAIVRPDWTSYRKQVVAILSAGLWASHPLSTAAVTYIIQRHESLASLLMMLSSYCWLRGHVERSLGERLLIRQQPLVSWQILALASALLALGSKQIAAGMPFILLLLDRWPLQKSVAASLRSSAVPVTLLLLLFLGFLWLAPTLIVSQSDASAGFRLQGINAADYWLSQPRSYLQYLMLTLFPINQVLDYGWIPASNLASQIFGLCGWVLMLITIVLTWRRQKSVAVLLSIILLILLPSSAIPMPDVVFEHRFYLSLAIVVAVALIRVANLAEKFRMDQGAVVLALAIGVVVSALTVQRNFEYSSASLLAQLDLARQPGNPRNMYRVAIKDESLPIDRRRALVLEAIRLSEQRNYFYPGTQYTWSREFADEMFYSNRFSLAKHWYLYALPHAKNSLLRAEVQWGLALSNARLGNLEEAERWFEEALSVKTPIYHQIAETFKTYKETKAYRRPSRGPEADFGVQGSSN